MEAHCSTVSAAAAAAAIMMMAVVISVTSSQPPIASSTHSVQWKDCSDGYGYPNTLNNVTFTSDQPKRGVTMEMTINITLGMIEDGGYGECKMVASSNSSEAFSESLSLCELHSCPIAKGLAYIDIALDIPRNTSQGIYSGDCMVFYGTRAYIFCVHVEMNII